MKYYYQCSNLRWVRRLRVFYLLLWIPLGGANFAGEHKNFDTKNDQNLSLTARSGGVYSVIEDGITNRVEYVHGAAGVIDGKLRISVVPSKTSVMGKEEVVFVISVMNGGNSPIKFPRFEDAYNIGVDYIKIHPKYGPVDSVYESHTPVSWTPGDYIVIPPHSVIRGKIVWQPSFCIKAENAGETGYMSVQFTFGLSNQKETEVVTQTLDFFPLPVPVQRSSEANLDEKSAQKTPADE